MNKIDIVTTSSEGDLKVGPNSDIQYRMVGGGYRNVTEKTLFRPLHSSELKKKLSERDYHCTPRKILQPGTSNLHLYRDQATNFLDGLLLDPSSGVAVGDLESGAKTWESLIAALNSYNPGNTSPSNLLIKEFLEILDMNNEISFFDNSFRNINVLDTAITVDALRYDSDIYTSTLSISNLVDLETVTPKVDLGIQYVKGDKVYCYHSTFTSRPKEEWVEDVEGEIQIEYTDGLVQIYPTSEEVLECIISNCTLTYGNLKG